MKIADLYPVVTNRIIAELEAGTVPWTQPWKRQWVGGLMPTNAVTGRAYNGINIPILWAAAQERRYESQGWLTFQQAEQKGGHIRKGEKGTHVVFTKKVTVKNERDEDEQVAMLRTYVVFHVSQVEGIDLRPLRHELHEPHAFLAATGAEIRMGADPMYVPSKDFIALPPKSSFKSEAHYHATGLHEAIHWSGAPHRLNRDLWGRFGTKAYAAEEMIAELGAAFLCAHLGIEGQLRHADYIASWIELLKDDPRAIFTAASKAGQAATFLRSFSEEMDDAEQS